MDNVQYYQSRFGDWQERQGSWTWRYIAAGTLAVVFLLPVALPALAVAALILGRRAFTAPFAMMRNWSESTGGGGEGTSGHRHRGWGWGCGGGHHHRGGPHRRQGSTGNQAFDAYKADTLRRLEEEQDQFETFLTRLRQAKDKAEFDAFMNEQATRRTEQKDQPDGSLDDDGPVESKH
jgi:hypothetical protein